MLSFSKTLLAATLLALPAALAASPAPAAAEDVRGQVDISVFYGTLAPYGTWVQSRPYGWVWVPEDVDYDWRPYTVGRWVWVDDYGWTWASDEDYGWAVYHYGRWTWLEGYGWAWVPGSVWAPAWVVFRSGDGWIGWAPRPPESAWRVDLGFDVGSLNLDFSIGSYGWAFVPVRWFAEPTLRSRLVTYVHNPRLLSVTRPSTRYTIVGDRIVNRSIEVEEVERLRGARITRYKLEEATGDDSASAKTRIEGQTVRLRRPKVAPKVPEKAPESRPRAADAAGSEAWLEKRRAALKAHLDAQKRSAEEDADDKDAPPPVKPPSAEEAQKRREAAREAARKALEDERKRAEALLEWQRRRRQGGDAPPPPPKDDGKGDDGKGKDKDKDKGGMDDDATEKEKKEKERKEKEERESGMK